ncbi:adenosylcobinamide-GDP ribazoletransferase, partial [Chloroflexota bacterium]
ISLTAAVLLGWGGILLFAVATALAFLMGAVISRMIGGLTGDTYGFINEVVEASLLIIAVAILPELAVLPLWEEGF